MSCMAQLRKHGLKSDDAAFVGTAFEKIEFDQFLFQGRNCSGHNWSGMTLTKVQFYDVHS